MRPYARRVAGRPLELALDLNAGASDFVFQHDPTAAAPAEISVPEFQYPDGYEVEISDGEYQVDRRRQALIYRHSTAQSIHQIRVRRPKRH